MDTAIEARDIALEKVSTNNKEWMEETLELMESLPSGFSGTGEDIRVFLMNNGAETPNHHNVWGPLIRTAIKRGLINPTDKFENMKTKKSHARVSRVYVK